MDELINTITIDWDWVAASLARKERFDSAKDETVKKALGEFALKSIEISKNKAVPGIAIVKKDILSLEPGSIEIEKDIKFMTKELANHLKGASQIYIYVVTIGKSIENAATECMKSGDPLTGYLLDRTGSFAVESLAKNTEYAIRKALALQNLSVSMRFSPGYCDWPIEEQFKLAKLIDFQKAGVTLSENCMMIPKKSISAIVGIGPKELFTKIQSPCTVCNMKVCDYRRKD